MLRIMDIRSIGEASVRIVLVLLICGSLAPGSAAAVPTLGYRIIGSEPHDPSAFTQGLATRGGLLIEGTGLYGHSRLTIRDRASGTLLHQAELQQDEFGEGVTVVDDRIVQLTWLNAVAYIYDLQLKRIGRFSLPTEGWGLAYDGQRLILSNGSSHLLFLDSKTYSVIGSVQVTADGQIVERLNELEVVNGLVFANIWQTDRIAIIDPESGQVLGWLDLSALRKNLLADAIKLHPEFVLNGIALIPAANRLLVTGKCWPQMFEIEVDHQALDGLVRGRSHRVIPAPSRRK